ncbi:MAG: tetratricopeptide repeat protein [Bacteroidia bacterium]|nr:tetratricopeptide repeat protein [Bacteroidia bacterium]
MRFLLLMAFLVTGLCTFAQDLEETPPATEKDFVRFCMEVYKRVRTSPIKSKEEGETLLEIARERRWPFGEVWLILARSHWYLGDYNDSREYFRAALDSYEKKDDKDGMARAWEGLGMVQWRLGNFPGANKYLFESLNVREAHQDSLGLIDNYYWLGVLQADLGSYKEARDYYHKALYLAQVLGEVHREADIFNVIGRTWRKQGVYEKALQAHAVSAPIYEALKDSLGLSDYYNNVGSIYRRQGRYNDALAQFFNALYIQEKLLDKEGLADGYNDIGTTLMQKGDFEGAIKYLELGLKTAREIYLLDDVRYAYKSLASVYDSLGNYQLAFEYHKLFTQVKDSIYALTNNDIINQQRFDYEWQKAHEAREKEEEIRRERARNFILIVIGLLALAGGAVAFFFWQNRLNARINRQLEAKNILIDLQRDRAEKLLLNILPEEIANELKSNASGKVKARSYSSVTVMFVDFKGFTQISEVLSPRDLVSELHFCFRNFDEIVDSYGIEKIKTIGDAYMCAGGLPAEDNEHARKTVRAAMEIQRFMESYKADRIQMGQPYFEARIGVHSGPVVAGVVGSRKFAYDIWGDTVNTAARMESAGEVGKVNISSSTYKLVKDLCICTHRGKVHAKNKGDIEMYFVDWTM